MTALADHPTQIVVPHQLAAMSAAPRSTRQSRHPISPFVDPDATTRASTAFRTTSPMITLAGAALTSATDAGRRPGVVLAHRPDQLRRLAAGLPSLAAVAARRYADIVEQGGPDAALAHHQLRTPGMSSGSAR